MSDDVLDGASRNPLSSQAIEPSSSASLAPDGLQSGVGCRGNTLDLGAYFGRGERRHVACKGEPKWRVFVNPPKPGNDGTVLLCDHCNRFDYAGFRRSPLGKDS